MSYGRDDQGRFLKDEWKGGPGRPTKAREGAYRRIFSETITPEKFKASCQQVWLDSVGKKLTPDGKLLDDPHSTPFTRISAFARLASYVLGKPIKPVLVDSVEGDILAIFREMSDEQLQQIVDEAERFVSNLQADQNLPVHEQWETTPTSITAKVSRD